MIEVGADQIGVRRRARGSPALARPRRVGDDRFDLALDALGELLALAGEHLDAVVLERIVRRRDHHAGVVAVRRASGTRPPASARRRRSSPSRLRPTRRARARLRSSRPTRACRGRRADARRLGRRAAARGRAPRRAGGPSADRADSGPPCRARRRFRRDGDLSSQSFATGDSHLHGRGLDARDARVAATRRRARAASTRRARARRDRRRRRRRLASTRLERLAAAAQRRRRRSPAPPAPTASAPRLRRWTGRLRSVRSSGAGTICTVTIADRAVFRRSDGSSSPRLTVSRHAPRARRRPTPARSTPRSRA